jgi:adenine phosphoribosyltransferase
MTASSNALSLTERGRLVTLVGNRIRDVPDFPKPGILFRDITPVLADAQALSAALALHLDAVADLGPKINKVVGIESRGFLFGMALAARLGAGFVVIRKPGKLPAVTVETTYELEYGTDRLQIHADALEEHDRVLVVDDLLATGGTASAAFTLVEQLGASVEAALFLIELEALGGRRRLGDARVETILRYA